MTERNDAQESVEDPVGDWVRGLFRYYGKSLDPKVEAIYRAAFKSFPMDLLESIRQEHLQDPKAPAREVPTVAALTARIRRRQRILADRRAATAPVAPVPQDEYGRLRERLTAIVAMRMSRIPRREDPNTPGWLLNIAAWAVQQHESVHGLGPPTLDQVEEAIAMARRLYDDEVASSFDLTRPTAANN